ncbi:MAG: hypothetical protein A2177_00755 [Spirochaetes bacterium RBG_13_68_11]|nr:MAG: hypothetical protein A2177_00755 [Spirochaetes bacterium RBG_13_68_11]
MAPAFHRVCWLTYEDQSGFAVVVTVPAAETAALTFHRPRSRMAVSSVVSSVTDHPRPRNPPTATAASRRTAKLLPKQPNAPPSPTGAMLYWLMSGCSNAWNRFRNPRSSGSVTRPSTAPTDGSAKCAAISPAHPSGTTQSASVKSSTSPRAASIARSRAACLPVSVPGSSVFASTRTRDGSSSRKRSNSRRVPSVDRSSTRRNVQVRSVWRASEASRAGSVASSLRAATTISTPGRGPVVAAVQRNARSARSTFTSPAHPTAWKRSMARLVAA